MRWRWKRLLIVPLLATTHACDCGGCDDNGAGAGASSSGGCNDSISCGANFECGLLGQCASESEGGTCPNGMRLDTTTSCDKGASFCCVTPLPCTDLGGVCLPPGAAVFGLCSLGGTIEGDCGDAGVCCMVPGDDGSSGSQALDATSTDAEEAPDTTIVGSCNDAPCASGCTCMPLSPDAGGASPDAAALLSDAMTLPTDATALASDGATFPPDAAALASDGATFPPDAGGAMCVCTLVGSSTDAQALEDGDAGNREASSETADVGTSDVAVASDAMTPEDASGDAAAAAPCGVILCAAACTCASPAASTCVCP